MCEYIMLHTRAFEVDGNESESRLVPLEECKSRALAETGCVSGRMLKSKPYEPRRGISELAAVGSTSARSRATKLCTGGIDEPAYR